MKERPLQLFGKVAIPLYITLLLGLALLGAASQSLMRRQRQLIASKQALQLHISELHSSTADITSPAAISSWAFARGMVPVPEGGNIVSVAPEPAPTPPSHPTGLEMRTIWR